jgi:uncharacterized protein (DUF697 family)
MTTESTQDQKELTKSEEGTQLTKRYMLWTAGGGLIPIPLLDVATIMGVQIKMISDLSDLYEIPFSEHRVKNIIYPLVSSLGIAPIGAGVFSSLIKVLPVVGSAVGAFSLPLVASALTYATGRVFITHFEAGGTLLDFEPNKMREHFAKEFEEGKKVAQDLKPADDKSSTTTKSSSPAKKKAARKKTTKS